MFEQGCNEFSDHGYARIFIGNRDSKFLRIKPVEFSNSKEYPHYAQLGWSAIIIDKEYSKKVEELLSKYSVGENYQNCAFNFVILNKKEKIILEGAIPELEYFAFKKEFEELNKKFQIDKEMTSKMATYFWVIEIGTGLKKKIPNP